MSRFVVWVSSLTFALFGVLFLADPVGWAGTVGLGVNTPTARTEIRAMYGGFELGLAMFLGWCAIDQRRVRAGLIATAWLFAGVASGRSLSLLTDPGSLPIMLTVVVVEWSLAALAALALRRDRTTP